MCIRRLLPKRYTSDTIGEHQTAKTGLVYKMADYRSWEVVRRQPGRPDMVETKPFDDYDKAEEHALVSATCVKPSSGITFHVRPHIGEKDGSQD